MKINNDPNNAGIVVHIMFLMCANKSVPAIDDAKFVESDNGELLSPKIAPDSTAPATIPGSNPIAVPTPINATPTVAIVVKAEPIIVPISAIINNALGKNHCTLAIFSPTHNNDGMVLVAIHNPINIPINRNKNNGASAFSIPFSSCSWIVCQDVRRILANIMTIIILITSGTLGDNPN